MFLFGKQPRKEEDRGQAGGSATETNDLTPIPPTNNQIPSATSATSSQSQSEEQKRVEEGHKALRMILVGLQNEQLNVTLEQVQKLVNKYDVDVHHRQPTGETLAHWAVWNGDLSILRYLVEECEVDYTMRNQQDQTPLHWAFMKGSISGIKYLMRRSQKDGRSLSIQDGDSDGFSGLHCAAQFDHCQVFEWLLTHQQTQPSSHPSSVTNDDSNGTELPLAGQVSDTLVKPMMKMDDDNHNDDSDNPSQPNHSELSVGNIDWNLRDKEGRSPLHWASFSGYMVLIQWLLSNTDSDLTIADKDGDNPLHIAVGLGHSACVRTILRHGNPDQIEKALNTKNSKGLTPRELALDRNRQYLVKLLTSVEESIERSKRNSWMFLFNFLWNGGDSSNDISDLVSNRAMSSHTKLLFWGMWVASVAVDAAVLLPSSKEHWSFHAAFLGGMFMMALLWFRVHLSDPGFIQPSDSDQPSDRREYLSGLESSDRSKICVSCRIVRPLRSKHCTISGRCVRNFDHFCPFVGNAVGEQNYRSFVSWLTLSVIMHLYGTALTILHLVWSPDRKIWTIVVLSVFGVADVISFVYLLLQFITHMVLISQNLTTNERINLARYAHFRRHDGHTHNPFSEGCCGNWCAFICGTRKNTIDPQSLVTYSHQKMDLPTDLDLSAIPDHMFPSEGNSQLNAEQPTQVAQVV